MNPATADIIAAADRMGYTIESGYSRFGVRYAILCRVEQHPVSGKTRKLAVLIRDHELDFADVLRGIAHCREENGATSLREDMPWLFR